MAEAENTPGTRIFMVILGVLSFAVGLFLMVMSLWQGQSGWQWHSGPLAYTRGEVVWAWGLVAITIPLLALAGYVAYRLIRIAIGLLGFLERKLELSREATRIALEERRERERERNRDAFVAAYATLLDEMRDAEAQTTITENTNYKQTFLTFTEEHGLYVSEPYEDHGGYNMEVFTPEGMVFEGKYGSRSKRTFLWSSSIINGHARLTEPNWLKCLDNLKQMLPLKQSTFNEEVCFMGAEKNYRKGIEQALQSRQLNLMVPQ